MTLEKLLITFSCIVGGLILQQLISRYVPIPFQMGTTYFTAYMVCTAQWVFLELANERGKL